MFQNKTLKSSTALLLAFCMSTVGCSNGLQSSGGATQSSVGAQQSTDSTDSTDSTNQPPIDLSAQYKAVEDESKKVDKLVAEAEKALDNLFTSSGQLRKSSSGGASATGEVQAEFVAEIVDVVLQKALKAIGKIPESFNTIRSRIADQMSKLDPSNPAHAAAIAKLMALSQKVDTMEARVKSVVLGLADKIDFVVDKLNMILSGINPILGFLLSFEVNRIKAVIEKFKQQLEAMLSH